MTRSRIVVGWLYTLLYISALAALSAVTACESGTVYNSFKNTALSGWEKNDTLFFSISPVEMPGKYNEEIGLRINGDYPFTGVTLIIEQTVIPDGGTRCDTLKCALTDSKGRVSGHGISYYQYMFPLACIDLARGDSLQVSVRHVMKREILPGIANIGLRLSRM